MNPKSNSDLFIDRHLGLKDNDEKKMLQKLGFNNIEAVSYTHLTLPTKA